VSCHPIAAPARTHKQRASATSRAQKYLGILSIDNFNFGIKWIAVKLPCRQLSPKRSKPSQFIFIRVREPVSQKSRNPRRPALPQPGPASWVFEKNRPPQRRPFLFRKEMEPYSANGSSPQAMRQKQSAASHQSAHKYFGILLIDRFYFAIR
jgi:hypothetical protein